MNLDLLKKFQTELDSGLREDAARTMAEFIASFADFEEMRQWVRHFLDNRPGEGNVRHELYEQVIFPVLLDGFQRDDTWSLHWLYKTAQNLYRARHLWQQIGYKSDHAILIELVRLCPDDVSLRAELLKKNIGWLQHAVHEWPSGILYGMNGATLEQCQEIAGAVVEARQQDDDGQYAAFLSDFEGKLAQYVERLKRRKGLSAQ